jgi:hypothetical protein
MGSLSNDKKNLADEARTLDKENRKLREEKAELEAKVSEYETKLGIKQSPDSGITLKDYLDGLNERKSGYNGEKFVIKEARILAPTSKRDWVFGFHYLQFTIDGERAKASFIHWCPKKREPIIKDIIDSVANTDYKITVIAHNKNYFVRGIIKQDGEKINFDDL